MRSMRDAVCSFLPADPPGPLLSCLIKPVDTAVGEWGGGAFLDRGGTEREGCASPQFLGWQV